MKKLDLEIIELCKVMLGEVHHHVKNYPESYEPIRVLVQGVVEGLDGIDAHNKNNTIKRLKKLQSAYDAYNGAI